MMKVYNTLATEWLWKNFFEIEDHLRYHKINYGQKSFGLFRGEFIWNQLPEDLVNQHVDWVYLNLNWTTDFPASVILYYNV